LLADDINLIVSNPKYSEFFKDIKVMFAKINNWLRANLPSFGFEKTSFMQFLTNSSPNLMCTGPCIIVITEE